MKYNELFFFRTILILFIIYKSRIGIVFKVDIDNNNKSIKLNLKYLFNLININIQIYPPKKYKKESIKKQKVSKKEKRNKKVKIFKEDVLEIINIIKNIKINELYSNIVFGNQNIYFTSFIYVFINTIYGNIFNIINSKKIYLSINPSYTENFIKGKIELYISPRIEDFFKLGFKLIKIYRNRKDGGKNETNKYTKSYGDNSWNY